MKHFIKNIIDVQKEEHPRIFIPEVMEKNQAFLSDLSEKLKQAVFAKQSLNIGWGTRLGSSVVYKPSHKDLVVKKPFIVALLSGAIEKVVEGTPLSATLIQE